MKQSNSGIVTPYQNVTTTVKLKGKEVKVHALSTGSVAVKNSFMTKKGPGLLSKVNIILDKTFTEYLPIWVWVIEHPDGLMIVDTGENAEVKDSKKHLAGENKLSQFISNSLCKFMIEEDESIDHQLETVNLRSDDVKLVAMTHLHLDHTDGLKFFPKAEIIVNEYEHKHPNSNLPTTYPKWFNPNPVNFKKDMVDVFHDAYPISVAGDLLYVPTPGHTDGHSSIILKTDEFDVIFGGDISYTQEQVINNEFAGANMSFEKARQSYANVMNYAKGRNTIYLPSHDPNAGNRLRERKFLVHRDPV